MTPHAWTYPPELSDALLGFGLKPARHTPPGFVRAALHELYRYELRRLRDDHRAGRLPKPAFLEGVLDLRRRYWPLTLQEPAWVRICGESSRAGA